MAVDVTEKKGIDFTVKEEKGLLKLIERLYNISEDYRYDFEHDWIDCYQLYYGMLDLAGRDPNLLHAHIPEAFSIIESVTPDDVKALMGSQPYFPLDPKEPVFRGATNALEKLLDLFCDEAGFFDKMAVVFKMKRLLGPCGVMPYWSRRKCRKPVSRDDMIEGYLRGKSTRMVEYYKEGWELRVVPPWNIGVDPKAGQVANMRWIYVKMPMSKSELSAMMSEKGSKWAKKVDDLVANEGHEFDSFLRRLENDIGYAYNRQDDDIGQLLVLWFPQVERYIWCWGHVSAGLHVIRDVSMALPFVNLEVFQNTVHPIPERFYSQGEIRPAAQLFTMLNDAYSQLFNAQAMNMNPPTMYPQGWIEPQLLRFSPGAKVPYNSAYQDRIRNAIWSWPVQQLDKAAYDIPVMLREMIKNATGVPGVKQGQFPERKELAYTVRKVTEGADSKTAMNLRISEQSMRRLAMMSWRIIDLCIPPQLAEQMLGEDMKYYELFRHPEDIPFGVEMRFKSSAMMTDRDAKTQKLLSYLQLATPDMVNKAALFKKALELDLGDMLSDDELAGITNVQPPQPQGQPNPAGMGAPPSAMPMRPQQMMQGAA